MAKTDPKESIINMKEIPSQTKYLFIIFFEYHRTKTIVLFILRWPTKKKVLVGTGIAAAVIVIIIIAVVLGVLLSRKGSKVYLVC